MIMLTNNMTGTLQNGYGIAIRSTKSNLKGNLPLKLFSYSHK